MSHKVLIFKQIIITILVLFLFIGISNQSYAADITNTKVEQKEYESKNIKELFKSFYKSTGIHELFNPVEGRLGPE